MRLRCIDLTSVWWQRVALALLLLFVALLYWPGLSGGFFFDDGVSITQNPKIRISAWSLESLSQAWSSGSAGPTGRPLSQLSFALNYTFGGLSPYGYKAFNLALHLLVTMTVFLVVKKLLVEFRSNAEARENAWLALAVAAFWALHPIQLLAVLHVVQRMTSLSALFLLLALYFHMCARQSVLPSLRGGLKLLAAWGIFWPASILCKETGALFPLFVLVYEWTIHRRSAGKWDRFALFLTAAQVLLFLLALVYLFSSRADWLWSGYDMRSFDLSQRLLTEARVIWYYLFLIVLPRFGEFALFHDDFPLSTGWFEPLSTTAAVLGLAALLVLAWRYRQRAALPSFCVGWFLAGHVLESTVIPLELVHEHRNYLPSLGIVLLIVPIFDFLQAMRVDKKYAFLVLLPFLAYSGFLTGLRAHQYGSDWRRVQTEAVYHPESPRNLYAAGAQWAEVYAANRDNSYAYSAANFHIEKTIQLDHNFMAGFFGRIYLDCLAGKAVEEEKLEALTTRLATKAFAPGDQGHLHAFKEFMVAHPHCLTRTQIERVFDAALSNPKVVPGLKAIFLSWYADYFWLREQDWKAAKKVLLESLHHAPGVASNRLKLAQIEILSGLPVDRERLRKELERLPRGALSPEEVQTIAELLELLAKPAGS